MNYINLLTEDWKNCECCDIFGHSMYFADTEVILGNNGGSGGTRDAGCLRYDFAATQPTLNQLK